MTELVLLNVHKIFVNRQLTKLYSKILMDLEVAMESLTTSMGILHLPVIRLLVQVSKNLQNHKLIFEKLKRGHFLIQEKLVLFKFI